MIKVGDTVLCRYYNTPEGKFYGEYFKVIILDIDEKNKTSKHVKSFYVKHLDGTNYKIWLYRKEIKKIVKD